MAKHLLFTLADGGVSARARLLEAEAPLTCRAIWEALPLQGQCFHAIYSGTCVALLIDPAIVLPDENATCAIQTGDLMFTHYDASFRHGHGDALSEIYWAYDRYCQPTAPGRRSPVFPNVFGTFLPGAEAFFEASRRMQYEGARAVTVAGETSA